MKISEHPRFRDAQREWRVFSKAYDALDPEKQTEPEVAAKLQFAMVEAGINLTDLCGRMAVDLGVSFDAAREEVIK